MLRVACTVFTETYQPNGSLRRRSTKTPDCTVALGASGRLTVEGPRGQPMAVLPARGLKVIGGMAMRGMATLMSEVPSERMAVFISDAASDELCTLCKALDPTFAPRAAAPAPFSNALRPISGNTTVRPLLKRASAPTPVAQPAKRAAVDAPVPITAVPAAVQAVEESLNAEQRAVLTRVLNGENVFFTGSAGSGKSHLLRCLAARLPRGSTVFTATTGIAAAHVGGVTVQSFSGISSPDVPEDRLAMLARGPRGDAWRQCSVLVIDEISMLDGRLFDLMDRLARLARSSSAPFGGVQLVLSGDFFQLPPVSRDAPVLCFQSAAWQAAGLRVVILKTVFRQADAGFVAMLAEIREGRCSPATERALQATANNAIDRNGVAATQLHTHNEGADAVNAERLRALPGEPRVFEALDSTDRPALIELMDRTCPARRRLELKVGAQVILLKNVNVMRGRVNGARGVVVRFANDLPVVRFLDGTEEVIGREKWSFDCGLPGSLVRRQLPLALAWALSVHKSQGMSLDCVEVSLGRAFSFGQVYVALSRARSLEGLRVVDFDRSKVRANPAVVRFYQHAAQLQRAIENTAF